jgi:hypothetical protein
MASFTGKGRFRVAPGFNLEDLEKLFRHSVLSMLLRKGKITREFVRMMEGWRHSGFNVFCGERIYLKKLSAFSYQPSAKTITARNSQTMWESNGRPIRCSRYLGTDGRKLKADR